MNRIQIKNDKPQSFGIKVIVDGNEVHYVRSVDFSVSVDEIPNAK